jgi:hypothetical protein
MMRKEDIELYTKLCSEISKEREYLEELSVNEQIILKIFEVGYVGML